MGVVGGLDILVNGRGGVDIVDHEIERAVVVEVGVGGAVGKARMIQSPLSGSVRERQVAVAAEDLAGDLVATQVLQNLKGASIVSGPPGAQHGGLVIEIIHGFGVAARDENVLVPVVVEV